MPPRRLRSPGGAWSPPAGESRTQGCTGGNDGENGESRHTDV